MLSRPREILLLDEISSCPCVDLSLRRNLYKKGRGSRSVCLTVTEIHNAEIIALRKSQRDLFRLDIEALRANKRLPARLPGDLARS